MQGSKRREACSIGNEPAASVLPLLLPLALVLVLVVEVGLDPPAAEVSVPEAAVDDGEAAAADVEEGLIVDDPEIYGFSAVKAIEAVLLGLAKTKMVSVSTRRGKEGRKYHVS